MARSFKTKIEDLNRIRSKAEEMMRRAAEEEEKIMAPTRNKLIDILGDRVRLFLKAHLGRIPEMTINRDALAAAFDDFLMKALLPGERPNLAREAGPAPAAPKQTEGGRREAAPSA